MQRQKWLRRYSAEYEGSDRLARAIRCEWGATSIEYALIAALLAITAITGLHTFGSEMREMYNRIGTAVQNAG